MNKKLQNIEIPNYTFDEEHLTLTLNIINDSVLIHPVLENGFDTFVTVNNAAIKKYGYTHEEFLKLSPVNLTDEKDRGIKKRTRVQENLINERQYTFETVNIKKDGEHFPVEINTSLIKLNSKLMIFAIVRDLSERNLDKQAIDESQKMLEGIFRVAPAGIGMVSNRVFTEVNPMVCELTGYTKEELLGKKSQMLYPTEEDYYISGKVKYKQIAEKGKGSVETRWMRKDGSIIDILLASTTLDINDYSKGVIFTVWDITLRKKQERELQNHKENLEKLVAERTHELEAMNEELKAANEELFEKNDTIREQNTTLEENFKILQNTQNQLIQTEKMASLGILTSGVAHEINNPLNFIRGGHTGLTKFLENYGNESDEAVFYLNSIDEGINRASDIVRGLNQFSRHNNDTDELCHIHTIIENCLQILLNAYKNRIEIVKEYFNEEIIIKGNAGKMHQVFINLLNNAIDAIENSGSIKIKTVNTTNDIEVYISDTGKGIDPEIMNKISDPFFTTKEPGKGTGLGLSIVYGIVQEHTGNIHINSKPGVGTTVKIILPK